jgi:hypothetical protein
MATTHRPSVVQRSPFSFETLAPGALATWLLIEHGFTEQIPMANEAYRLASGGMVISVFPSGLVLAEGRNAAAAAEILKELCDADGGGT